MEAGITDSARSAMVRAAVARVGRDELKAALALTADPRFQAPKAIGNALNALRKHRDPAGVVTRPQYRAAVPYVAAALADDCLARTIEVLGDHSDDPTREQLLDALDQVRASYPDDDHRRDAGHGGRRRHARFRSVLRDPGRRPRFGLTDVSDAEASAEQPRPADTARPDPVAGTAGGPAPEEAEGRRGTAQEAGGGPEGGGAAAPGPEEGAGDVLRAGPGGTGGPGGPAVPRLRAVPRPRPSHPASTGGPR